jgi:hypothetical protein
MVMRFRADDGTQEDFIGGWPWLIALETTPPEQIKEVVLVSNHDYYDNRLDHFAITTEGDLRHHWHSPGTATWTEVANTVDDADRGLDACSNMGFSEYYLWASYIDSDDTLRVNGINSDGWTSLLSSAVGTLADMTAIGAYRDTITCFFEYTGTTHHLRYNVSYDGGDNWLWWFVDDTTKTTGVPDVTARYGGGTAVVYLTYTPFPEFTRGFFTYRRYAGIWDLPLQYADYQPDYEKPAVEYLGDGLFGIIYINRMLPTPGGVYFDTHYRTALPDMEIGIVPVGAPIEVSPGGHFRYHGGVANNKNQGQYADIWFRVRLPGGSYYTIATYTGEMGEGIYFPPTDTMVFMNIRQDVPAYSPPGRYSFIAYVGDYPAARYDSSFFYLDVASGVDGPADEWNVSGFDDPFEEISATGIELFE